MASFVAVAVFDGLVGAAAMLEKGNARVMRFRIRRVGERMRRIREEV